MCMHVSMRACVFVCVCLCVFVCMCVCMCVYSRTFAYCYYQATDPESGDFGIVWYRSVTEEFRFNISRETGNIVSNQISQGKAGTSFKFEVEAYDNKGRQPSLSTRQEITVRNRN